VICQYLISCSLQQVIEHLRLCKFVFPKRGTPEWDTIDEVVSCVAKSSRLRGVLDDYDFEDAGNGLSDQNSESGDEESCSSGESESKVRYQTRKKQRKKKTQEQKKREMEERKAAEIKQRQEAAGGNEWKGWIYLHPSARCKWGKVGGTLQLGRSEGQASSTFGPDVVYRKFDVNLGSVADTSKRMAKRRLKQSEASVRLIFNRNHVHSKREVRPLLPFAVAQCIGCIT
jgi:hypothetical protein